MKLLITGSDERDPLHYLFRRVPQVFEGLKQLPRPSRTPVPDTEPRYTSDIFYELLDNE